MDVTTLNDRHLYQGRVTVRDPVDPAGSVDLPGRVVRFGPPGWLTVVEPRADAAAITLYPTGQVLAVTELREVDQAGPGGGTQVAG
jgi:hypothetical protein